ncbi:MAG: glycosyltransferase family 2 protein, partial [Thermoleophilia bacterium]|nr:glycosyltransferase family 2 protein [Thermoleophilia bacterium]
AVLAETLASIDRQVNRAGVELELLVVDSGSTDGSAELAERHGARVIRIDKANFSHGGTRNMAVAEAKGDAVAMLTQDAAPLTGEWVDAIVEGFALADDVALVFGPHIPRREHSHVVKRELLDHFRIWERGGEPLLRRIEPGPGGVDDYRQHPGDYQFFSDVNGALARWAWERVPYREVPYAEDQLLGREMIEAGFAKVYHPRMAVVHSHDYSPLRFMKRYFDEYRGLREVLGYIPPIGLRSALRTILGLSRGDRRYLRGEGVKGRKLFTGTLHSLRHHSLRLLGQTLGGRADRVPSWLSRRLSLEGRGGFAPVELPGPLLAGHPDPPAPEQSNT